MLSANVQMCILCKLCVLHKTLARMKPESHLPVFTRPKIMDGRNWLIQNKKAEKIQNVGIMLEDEGNDNGDKQDNDNDDDDNNNDNSDDNIDDDD